jgi:hypothetical protein
MCYEMGIEDYEKRMSSNESKKKTIKEFIHNNYYDEHIRSLINEGVHKNSDNINLKSIIEVIDKQKIKKWKPVEAKMKRQKTGFE